MPSIKPSLFIGLGTSGAEILGHLQELIVQEYLVEQFPVTRLLSFVTEESDGRVLRHASREQVVHLAVPSTQVIRNEITSPTTKPTKALAAWLPREVCVNATQFMNGSNNMRAAGRLQLWRNYTRIREKIADNVRACTTLEARRAAAQHLVTHLALEASKTEGLVEDGLNVYVVGSLCGGTCSGMFLDLGFLLRSLPELVASGKTSAVKIFGVFTILNKEQAGTPDWELQAANCHAALKELDFCHHVIGVKSFPIAFPDGEEVVRDHAPYDYVYLLGATSMASVPLVGGDNKFSHKALLQMIAHNLFLDSYAGTSSIKEGMRTNWGAVVVPGAPDPRKRNPRILFSFGCAMVTYPMYSIARATAALVAKDVCSQWLTPKGGDFLDLIQESQMRLNREIFPRLTQPEGIPPITEELRNEIRRTQAFLSLPAEALRTSLLELPDPRNPIAKRFQQKGRYYTILKNQYEQVVEPLCRELIRDFIQRCRVERGCGLPDVFAAIGQLREMLEKEKRFQAEGGATAVFEVSRLDPVFAKLYAIERDLWLKIMGLRRIAELERKEQVRAAFERLALHALSTLAAEFRRRALEGSLTELKAVEDDLRREEQLLRELADPDNHGEGYLAKQAENITDSLRTPPRNVSPVWAARDGTVDSELTLQQSRTSVEEAEPIVISAIAKSNERFTAKWTESVIAWNGSEELGATVLDALTLTILRRMKNAGVQVLNEALRKWDTIREVVNYASPYMQFTQEYLEAGTRDRLSPPGLTARTAVFGDAPTNEMLSKKLEGKVPQLKHQDAGVWGYHALQGLAHYLVFYQEEAYFSTTYMAASESYEKAYGRHRLSLVGAAPMLRWTDQRWHPHGPPIGDLDRAEYLGFLLEHALDLLVGTRVSGDNAEGDITDLLFRWLVEDGKRKYFFELPSARGIGERVYVGTESDYLDKAKRDTARRFIPYLVEKLSSVVNSLGTTPAESLDKFKNRFMVVQRRLDLEREEGLRSRGWTAEQLKAHQERNDRLHAFFLHVRELTWIDMVPDDEERECIRKFAWLINWAREEY